MTSSQPHLVLIDGHHLMYRAYWAIPRTLTTKAGEQTNAVFGVASMLLNILTREKPTHLLFCFDEGSETFRHEENETYKEGRAETPDDFYEQIPRILELVDGFSFSSVSDPKYEADDFLGSYAVAAAKEGMKVTIVTGDRDAYQLASDQIQIAIPHKGYQQAEYLDAAGVEAKLGVRPDQVACYKGLCGDSSDNLPGVMGIGPKGAVDLLQEFDTLEGIYEHIDEIKGSKHDKLVNDEEQAFFCKKMAQLVLDIPLPEPLEELQLEGLPVQPVLELFRELEFYALQKRLQALLDTEYGQAAFTVPESVTAMVADVFGGGEKEGDDGSRQMALL